MTDVTQRLGSLTEEEERLRKEREKEERRMAKKEEKRLAKKEAKRIAKNTEKKRSARRLELEDEH
jgi:regulator of replication initiation timing